MIGSASTTLVRMLLGLVLSAGCVVQTFAQTYPVKPIKFIAPFPPGGSTDTLSRLLALKLADGLGQPVTVENRPGAAAMIGLEAAAKSPPDGYTITLGSSTMATNPHLYKRVPFDAQTDFMPVSLVASSGSVLVVHPSVNVTSVKELIELAKAKPSQLNFGSGGKGVTSHVAGEMFQTMTGTKMVHVPYKGYGQAQQDLVAGQVQLAFGDMAPAIPQIRNGKLRPLAVTTEKRQPALPDVPTMIEAGIAGFTTEIWWALMVPRATPRDIVNRLNEEVGRIMKLPDVQARYENLGLNIKHTTPEFVLELLKDETVKRGELLRKAGIQPE